MNEGVPQELVGEMMMNKGNTKVMTAMREVFRSVGDGKVARVADCFLNAKGRFCRVTMMPQASDAEKRNGKRRVFIVNIASNWLNYEKKHFGGDGKLTEVGKKIVQTKFSKGMISVVESVRDPKGRFVCQPRTIDLKIVDNIRYGGHTYQF